MGNVFNMQFTVGVVRMILIAYILLVQIPFRIRYENRMGRNWRAYLLHSNGIADVGIIGICFAVFYIRFIRLARSAAATLEYSQSLRGGWQDVSRDADLYNWGIR